MNIVLNELKQYVIKEVEEKIKLNGYDYFNLKYNAKYLVCFYDKDNEPICCEYLGYYISTDCDYDIYLGYDFEGYYFSPFSFNSNSSNSSYTTHRAVKEINEDGEKEYSYHNFFELEHTFNFNTMNDIYEFVISNIEPNISVNLHFDYMYDLKGEKLSCIIFDKKKYFM